jgi:glycerophosphoryl diester phosphodiesterase
MIWAHRGASTYKTENTMPSFELAARQGADGIELDVQVSIDGIVVVHHDENVDRVWEGTGAIKYHTYAQLRNMRARSAPGDGTTYIPTLSEVLLFCSPIALRVNIELKTGIERYPGIEKKVIELVEQAQMKQHVIYSSFNKKSLVKIRDLDNGARTGFLYSGAITSPWILAKAIGAYAVHPEFHSFQIPGLIQSCHENGVAVNVWTIDEPALMRRFREQGADGIITNRTDVAVSEYQR